MLKLFVGLVIAAIVFGGTAIVLRAQLLLRRDSSPPIRQAMEGASYFSTLDRQIMLLKLRKEMSGDDRALSGAYVVASVAMAICITAAILVSSYAL